MMFYHPKLVKAGWESLLLYPLLRELADEEGRIEEEWLDPVYLNAVTRVPVEVLTAGISGLTGVLLTPLGEGLYGLAHAGASAPTREGGRMRAQPSGHNAQPRMRALEGSVASVRASTDERPHAHEAVGFEKYLNEQWGELVNRGKPLHGWIALQQDAHPSMDLLAEAKKARAWELSQKKPKRSIRRFLTNWFSRADGFNREIEIRAEGGVKHWSGMNKRERDKAISSGGSERCVTINGCSVNRDLDDNLFILSGQDICNPTLPWRKFVAAAIKRALEGSGDPYDQDEIKAALGVKEPARAENDRALTWAIDQIVTDVRYELGILPV